jgi:diguanylate cyclase (GGDEF)-like protein
MASVISRNSLGHSAGDKLLKAFSGQLIKCVRRDDTVARLGGDEFVI